MAGKRKFKTALGKSRRARVLKRFKAAPSRRSRPHLKNTVNSGLGFPKKIVMTHKYYDTFKLTSTTGIMQVSKFSCNGMYDPDISGTGHQPMYFDQMTSLYNHYCVIGSRIKVRFVPNNALTKAVHVGLFINDDATVTPTESYQVAEQSTGKLVQLAPLCNTSRILTSKWSARKMFGKSPLANPELQGTVTSNPTEQSNWNLTVQAFDGGTESIAVEVEVSYIAVWKEIKDIPSS